MTEILVPDEYESPPSAACSLCGEPMVFVGRSKYGTPLYFCDNTQEAETMPDDGKAWQNLLQQRIRESG